VTLVLHRAERADALADALAEVLTHPLTDPFRAEVVAVHSRGIERWLSNRLAARLGTSPGGTDGVCANLDLPFPGRLVGAALAGATGVDPRTDPWRPERLAWPLLDVVDRCLHEPWLAVLAGHLGERSAAPGTGAHAPEHRDADRDRRFAAVRNLADLYDRYAVHRPAMLLAWADGRDEDGDGAPLPADATWQARLWREVRSAVGTPSPPERLTDGCAALAADPTRCDLPDRVSLFGLTRLPASYLEVLVALSAHRDVHVFALHPSPRSWETIRAAVEAGDRVDPALAATNPLLRAWGRDSREMHLVLAERLTSVGGVVEHHHPVPAVAPTTLLGRLQAGIRADADPGDASGTPPALDADDRSVQVHGCHGRARQAEVVRDAITHLLAADPSLEPRDIVVMCPDIDEMAPFLRAAFDAPAGGGRGVDAVGGDPSQPAGPAIPYRLADRSIRQTNPVLGAVAQLLALVDARLTASQVLSFAGLGPVRARFGFDDDELERVAQWVGDAGIRWGLDAQHRAPYDLASVEAGTWDAGLQRLLLGVAMSEDGQRLVGGVLPLDDVDSGDIDLAGRLAELVGRLGDVVRAADGARPVGGWLDLVDGAADLLLHTRPADAWQRGQLDRLLAEVRAEAAGGDSPPLRLAEIRDLLADRLRGQPSRAAFRTGDLTMCTLVPMRSVPHRVVCLVGLDDGSFPRGGAPDGDDLLVRARHVGDHDRRAEDRQLLLDAVLAASDALVITYAGRDHRTNEVLPPAVPVNELLDVVDATSAGPGATGRARDIVVRHHPLQPTDPRCFTSGALGVDGPWGFDPHQLAGARASLGPLVVPGPFLGAPLPPVAPTTVGLDDLVGFVQHPAKAFLRQRLGLSTWGDDDRPPDRLSIELDHLAAWSIGDRMLTALLAGGDPDGVAAAEVARGLLPPGALGTQVLERATAKAVAIADAARRVSSAPRGSLEVDVELPDGRRLVGTVPDVVGDIVRATTFSKIAAKRRLAAWVRFLAAVAAHPDLPLTSVTVGWGRNQPATVGIGELAATPPERRAVAVAHLATLVDLRDRGLREPIPLFCDTSHTYVEAQAEGDPDAAERAGGRWTSTFDHDREDRDPAHVLVFDGERPWADVLRERPAPGEDGAGWALGEPTRFGRLARRLWDPVLRAPRRPVG
jgi:exodeoxyribonuclease V gamma subunit